MWPFGGAREPDVADELPETLQTFYKEAAPAGRVADVDRSPKDAVVQQMLAAQAKGYNHALAAYKREHSVRHVALVNCAELQHAVLECYKGWLVASGTHCSDEAARATRCLEMQQRALRSLRYDDCYHPAQCVQMRALVDRFFTTNFGQFGERITDDTVQAFDKDVDAAFALVWA